MSDILTKKDILIKVRNEQLEHLIRSEIDSKLFFQRLAGTDKKKRQELVSKRADVEAQRKAKTEIIKIINEMLADEEGKPN